jgi:histidinol dehydrogenase
MDFSSAVWFADLGRYIDADTARIVSALITGALPAAVAGGVVVAFLFRVKG